jgi:hypothetical protein
LANSSLAFYDGWLAYYISPSLSKARRVLAGRVFCFMASFSLSVKARAGFFLAGAVFGFGGLLTEGLSIGVARAGAYFFNGLPVFVSVLEASNDFGGSGLPGNVGFLAMLFINPFKLFCCAKCA